MKKVIIPVLFGLLFLLKTGMGQSVIHDALFLQENIVDDSVFKKLTLLKLSGYFNKSFDSAIRIGGEGALILDINQELRKNPFLKKYQIQRGGIMGRGNYAMMGNLAEMAGGIDVTSVVDGLAKFLVKRTKEELNVAFFSKFKETLNKPEYADLKTLFPATVALLDAIGDEIYNYNQYIQNLREAFIADLRSLDEHFPGIIQNHEAFFQDRFELAVGLNTACYLSTSLRDQVHPGDIIDQYPMEFLVKKGRTAPFNKDVSGSIQCLQLFSQSLRDTLNPANRYWVSFDRVKTLVNNQAAFGIYFGLLYEVAKVKRYDSVEFKNGSLVKVLDSLAVYFRNDYQEYQAFVAGIGLKVNEINELVKSSSKPASDSIAVEVFAKYARTSAELIEYATKVCELPHFDKITPRNFHQEFERYFKISYEGTDLAIDINRRNYSSAVNHAVAIYNLVRTKPIENDYYTRYPVGGDFKNSTEQESLLDSLKASKNLLQILARYGSFISSVATAANSEEVEKAFESAAMPSGSSRIKRETAFNVTVNAYTGLFIGHEKISGLTDYQFINNYGVTAPVGIAISWGGHRFLGLPAGKKGHWSYSAFISVIDIGAVASFRFQNDSIAQVPTIHLGDIVSPGLFLSIGIPKCPLSVNLGAQVGPNLRSVNVEDKNNPGQYVNGYQDHLYIRFSASLVVDIPIFNLYTKSKY